MTSPDSGSTRPLRVAGITLLGVAVVALVIGVITMFGGNGDGRADGNGAERPPEPTTTTSSTRPGNPPSSSTTSKSVPPTRTTTTTTTTATPPTTTTQVRPPGDGNGETGKTVPVRVLNNSKVKGLAATAADDLRADGWQVTIGNYSATNVPETTVYFRPGTAEEAAARALASTFGLTVAPRIDTIAGEPAGVIVIVTSDYVTGKGGGKNEG
jgi:hypothetical protein